MPAFEKLKRIDITGTSGAGTNYKILVTVYAGTGTDTTNIIYLNNESLSFPADIRFTHDKVNQLDYYYDPTQGESTVRYFWVEVAANLDTNQSIYIHYSKAGEASTRNWVDAIGVYQDGLVDASPATFSLRNNAGGFVAFQDKIWCIGGRRASDNVRIDDVWNTSDGITWTQVTASGGFGGRVFHNVLVYNNKLWVMGGQNNTPVELNDVWYSSDGITWTQATAAAAWPIRHAASVCVHNGEMYISGGFSTPNFLKDIYKSSDGVTWTLVNSNPGWSARQQQGFVSFDGNLYMYAGWDGVDYYAAKDCWKSTNNGVSWTQMTADMGMVGTARYGTTGCFVYDEKMWLAGGYSYITAIDYNDLYYSTNGVTWTRHVVTAGWSTRYFATVVILNQKAFLIGGYDDPSPTVINDVWRILRKYVYPEPSELSVTEGGGGGLQIINGGLIYV